MISNWSNVTFCIGIFGYKDGSLHEAGKENLMLYWCLVDAYMCYIWAFADII